MAVMFGPNPEGTFMGSPTLRRYRKNVGRFKKVPRTSNKFIQRRRFLVDTVRRLLSRSNLRLSVAAALALSASLASAQRSPMGNSTPAHPYRNLFQEDGHASQEIQAKVQSAYRQLFHGDKETQALYFPAGANANGPLGYVTDWANHDVRTEGMSYGMMLAVQLDHKADFDALWNWAMTYMYLSDPKIPSAGYFAWSCRTDGTRNSLGPAPDGEEYFAMALYFASARWGDGKGLYNYHAQADNLLRNMLHHTAPADRAAGRAGIGAEFDEAHHMVRFVPGANFTDPSYHLPAFYELWARWGPVEDRAFWQNAARTSRTFFSASANPGTGLTPAYANFDGTPHQTNFGQSTIFGFDSWRTASNWAVDWNWWHADPAEQILSDRFERFFAAEGENYPAIYTLSGTPLRPSDPIPSAADSLKPARGNAPPAANHDDHSPDYQHAAGLVSTNAVTALAATDRTRARHFVEALWTLPVPAGQFRYYNGMLYLLSLLHCSGEFRIWEPSWAHAAPSSTNPPHH
jgi:oligosaccharide reducing-end xylanase